jgi:glucosamine--fructose-6-phosphate aminotransferase (isomerizing)
MVESPVSNEVMLRDMQSQREALAEGIPTLRAAAAQLSLQSYRRVIISGSGDSFIAAVAVEGLFQQHLDIPVLGVPALDASRFRRPEPTDLTVVISISGEVSRGIELARAGRAAGATVIAVTASAHSTLAQSSDLVLLLPKPIDRSIPHSRDYSVTLLALACVLERLCGKRFDEVDALPALVGDAVPVALGQVKGLVTASGRTWFLGAGPDRGTAMYGSMKYWEAAGLESWWDDLEEFGHGSQLMAKPGDRAVVVAAGPGCQRGIEMIPGLQKMGLEVVLVGGAAFAGHGTPHLRTSDDVDQWWHPFVSSVPLQALTYVEANRRGLDVSVPLHGQPHAATYDDVHVEWTKHSQILEREEAQ